MVDLKSETSLAALIGDVVASRAVSDRSLLHTRLVSVLDQANTVLHPVVPLRVIVGDEYQGCFRTVGEALHATLWLRLHLPAEVRHGVGWGAVAVLAETPRVEDGPGWWAARGAIDEVKSEAARAGSRLLRTAYRLAQDAPGPDPAPVNAALMCQDQMIGSVSKRSLRLLRGALDGHTQAELAELEGISASAVSQRVRNDGLAVILAAGELLRGVK